MLLCVPDWIYNAARTDTLCYATLSAIFTLIVPNSVVKSFIYNRFRNISNKLQHFGPNIDVTVVSTIRAEKIKNTESFKLKRLLRRNCKKKNIET